MAFGSMEKDRWIDIENAFRVDTTNFKAVGDTYICPDDGFFQMNCYNTAAGDVDCVVTHHYPSSNDTASYASRQLTTASGTGYLSIFMCFPVRKGEKLKLNTLVHCYPFDVFFIPLLK